MGNFSERSRKNLQGVHPRLVLVMSEAVKTSPVDFTVVEGVRTTETQKGYYAQGRTKSGAIITYADGVIKKSNHQPKVDRYGYAVDVYPFKDGRVRVTEPYVVDLLRQITDHIKATAQRLGVKIICGIDWRKPFDPPHIELNE